MLLAALTGTATSKFELGTGYIPPKLSILTHLFLNRAEKKTHKAEMRNNSWHLIF